MRPLSQAGRPTVDPELARYGTCTLDDDGCSTCGDLAVPVRVDALDGSTAEAVDRLGNRTRVEIDFVPETAPGDVLMIHMGVAIGRAERAGTETRAYEGRERRAQAVTAARPRDDRGKEGGKNGP